MIGVIQTVLLTAGLVSAASLQSVSGWGSNPSGIQMSIYVPDRLASKPPVIVALHGCGGTGQQMYSSSRFQTYADQYGFIMIYPSSNTKQGMACWDNHTPQSLTHNGGSDTQGIVQQVQYTLNKYNGDPNRVYAIGFSSGAMMTNNLAATYPDVFEAGAPFAGVPAACFAGSGSSAPGASNMTCANGQVIKSAQDWGNYARNAYPGYTGRRTRMQIWHGSADSLVLPALFQEELKQWSNVLGVSLTSTNSNNPESGYTQYLYGDGKKLVGYMAAGAGHGGVPYHESMVLDFFGVLTTPATSTITTTRTTTATTTMSPTTTPRTTPATTTPPVSPGGSQSKWGQCGGVGWTGFTACSAPAACSTLNPYYAQCL
ncbi:hypothetical protein TWF569_008989 [Orbilia oligospora]|uniref:Carboxylic ester hydrolase n=1 Tax=Orbilia oligospora TaxID=2813651 RepID=A0A7C8U1W6_ORBOL|nr:hypothetical protein TWF102_008375 [Orbilia oligospora]KAF3096286.1 hypothetical protein TWF103_009859 [Orbilia oligospora]KAF3097968.1 hypothetical protein TWF706_006910 [Orbilia oligospora]KAF3123513.1 hypothetical protein TWF703_000725 [Orbilia oligospora]KAF3145426.1 hypothetical protein TWF594_004363 [Orbilia oligospora]